MSRDLGKFKIGQEVWLKIENDSYLARHLDHSNIAEWIRKGKVIKIGRKYIYVEVDNNITHVEKFSKEDDYRSFYDYGGADYQLYLTKQDILDEVESDNLYYTIKYSFNLYEKNTFTLDQLRKIHEIIKDNNK